jgi:predicted DNA-binding transcriptional regulator YafY
MNRIDRLFGIVLRLQGRRRVRAEELAETFEVSKRTIYRDILALNELGVPVVSLPGQGYELMQGYFLPPLVFTREEAAALFLGVRLLGQQSAGRMAAGADAAMAKVAAVLPEATRRDVHRLGEMIAFLAPHARFDLDDPRLATLQHSLSERRVVRMRYHGRTRDEVSQREVEPLRLTYSDGAWYLQAFCRLRQGPREFRLERIETLELLTESFRERRIAADGAEDFGHSVEVRVRVARPSARWVRERQHYGFVAEESSDPDVVMTYRLDSVDEIVPWLRSWGPAVEVLSPPELRSRLRQDAQLVLELLTGLAEQPSP